MTNQPNAADQQLMASITAERRELAALLAALPLERWDSPTLCEGWRVREVVAHLTMPFRYTTLQVAWGVLAARGRFNRFADRSARRDAGQLSPDELTRILSENADQHWKPPGGGYAGALSHDVIHGLDISVGLGLDRTVPLDRVLTVLGGLKPKQLSYFGVDLAGVELRATDTDWSFGSGSPVTGTAQHLLLVACGRKLPPGLVQGAGSERFVATAAGEPRDQRG